MILHTHHKAKGSANIPEGMAKYYKDQGLAKILKVLAKYCKSKTPAKTFVDMGNFDTWSPMLFPSPASTSINLLKQEDSNSTAEEENFDYLENMIVHQCPDHRGADNRDDPDLVWNRRWVDVMDFLKGESERDYLVTNKDHKVSLKDLKDKYVLIAPFAVPILSGTEESMPCHALIQMSKELRDKDCKVVLIILGLPNFEEDDRFFYHFFSGFPDDFLAIPFWDLPARSSVFRSLCVTNHYSHAGVILDGEGRLLDISLRQLVAYGATAYYPFSQDRLFNLEEKDDRLKARLDSFAYTHADPSDSLCVSNLPRLTLSELLECDPMDCILFGLDKMKPEPLSALDGKLVGLYLCSNGDLMPSLKELQSICRTLPRGFELVVMPLALWDHPSNCLDHIKLSFDRLNVSSWWTLLPYNDSLIRTLWRIFGQQEQDRLILLPLAPIYAGEPYADVVLSSCIGWNAKRIALMYPFTREKVSAVRFRYLKNVTLLPLLLAFHDDIYTCNGIKFSLEGVLDKNVILYLNPYYGSSCFESDLDYMRNLYAEILDTNPDCLMVCVFSRGKTEYAHGSDLPVEKPRDGDMSVVQLEDSDVSDLSVLKPGHSMVSNLPWLMIYPPEHADKFLRRVLFPKSLGERRADGHLMVSFGEDGHIRSRRIPQNPYSVKNLFEPKLRQEVIDDVSAQVTDTLVDPMFF